MVSRNGSDTMTNSEVLEYFEENDEDFNRLKKQYHVEKIDVSGVVV